MREMKCATCADASCDYVGVRTGGPCEYWTNTDDPIAAADIATDLAPLSLEECERRGLRHSSEDR